MESNFDYNSVPYAFAHCFNNQCPKAAKCLRNLAAQHCTNSSPTLRIINPTCIPTDGGACAHFKSNRKIHVAWGIKHLLDNVSYKDVHELKAWIMAYFSRGKYYRFYRKESYLTPEDQEFIRNAFRQRGIKEEPVFESYSEEYRW